MRVTWDVFCSVVDNFGDIGVTWRLARQLVAVFQRSNLQVSSPIRRPWVSVTKKHALMCLITRRFLHWLVTLLVLALLVRPLLLPRNPVRFSLIGQPISEASLTSLPRQHLL